MQFQKEKYQYISNLRETKQLLETQICEWIQKYVIISPIEGVITLTKYWSENHVINTGERIATIVPKYKTQIIGTSYVPTTGFGKVEIGQNVNIKLSSFPYMEFGMLKGTIKTISKVPEKEGYAVLITLNKEMTTTYRENIKFIQEMDGTADIITKDRRVITRFIAPLRSLIDNN